MNIKDIYTNSKEEVIDFLLRYFCSNDISYVRVDDEVHFLDNIYRFYEDKDISLDSTLEKLYNTLNKLELSKKLGTRDDIFVSSTIVEDRGVNKYRVPNCNSNKKRLIKMQNREYNQKLNNRKR